MGELSAEVVEILIDLAELKLADLEVTDHEDRQVWRGLQRVLDELHTTVQYPNLPVTTSHRTWLSVTEWADDSDRIPQVKDRYEVGS